MPETRYEDRTDNVEEKLRLLRQACRRGSHDVAMSLVESLKETLDFERQNHRDADVHPLQSPTRPVDRLPAPWARWAAGWAFYKLLEMAEDAGIDRAREPVEIPLEFTTTETTDLGRELRVARLDNTTLREIPSQVHGEWRRGRRRGCRLLFLADVPARGRSHYLVLFGNPHSERPDYTTDLTATGSGYALDVANNHFTAHLSEQIGQLQSLDYRRGFGAVPYGANLTLSTGGEGHGEPPNIDWGPDYTADGNYQKFRVTAWPRCPNHEVTRGPLGVSLRRWGFPQSPIHPLFAPSRLHVDITYTFYAGQPWFLKQIRMEAVKPVEIAHIRDDEWLFWGLPFTDALWIDQDGRLHEGEVPAEKTDDMWGAGFFNQTSRDAFIALRLEHHAERFGPGNRGRIHHNGAPGLNYFGRGQVWTRSPVQEPVTLKAGTTFVQRTAYLATHYPAAGGAQLGERTRHKLLAPIQARPGRLPRAPKTRIEGTLARTGEAAVGHAGRNVVSLKQRVWAALREVRDDQLMTVDGNLADLGYIRDIRIAGDTVNVLLNMPHAGRQAFQFHANPIRDRLLQVDGVGECVVDCTWDPDWSPSRINDAGRRALQLSF